MKLCLDAGHGGTDPGALGPSGLAEAPVVLAITNGVVPVVTVEVICPENAPVVVLTGAFILPVASVLVAAMSRRCARTSGRTPASAGCRRSATSSNR